VHGQHAGVGLVRAGEHLHEGRLARAVLTDETVYLTREEVQAHLVQRRDGAERLADTAHGQRGRARRWARVKAGFDHLSESPSETFQSTCVGTVFAGTCRVKAVQLTA
jgi:hypothetical protein